MRLGWEYIAAFIDCDGSIGISRMKPKGGSAPQYYSRVVFYSQNMSVLREIQELVGGAIADPGKRGCYQLQLSPRDTLKCLWYVQPYLRIKRDQAALAIRLQQDIVDNPIKGNRRSGRRTTPQATIDEREAMRLEMKRLNHRDSEPFKAKRNNSVKAPRGVTPSQAAVGKGAAEGVTIRLVTPKNNPVHETPPRKGRHDLDNTVPTILQ